MTPTVTVTVAAPALAPPKVLPTVKVTKKLRLPKVAVKAKVTEHPDTPINRIFAKKHGFEIEFPNPVRLLPDTFDLGNALEAISIHQGRGGYGQIGSQDEINFAELSPGPFFHPATGVTIVRQYLHSGIIYPYLHVNHSIHLNTNAFLDQRDYPYFGLGYLRHLCCSLLLTGYTFDSSLSKAFHPEGIFAISHLKSTGVSDDEEETSTYRDEVVSFSYLYQQGFDLFWNEAINLANTASAHMVLKRRRLPSQFVRGYFEQLAQNWSEHNRQLKAGLASIHRSDLISLSSNSFDKTAPFLQEVFPDTSRGINPDDIETAHPIEVDGQRWPNIISFARDLNHRTSGITLSILGQFENEFLENLKIVRTSSDKTIRREFRKKYNLPEISTVEKEDTIEVLAALYANRL